MPRPIVPRLSMFVRCWIALLALAITTGLTGAAQEPPPDVRAVDVDSVARRVKSVLPKSGAPGTEVTLRSDGLPAITPLRIGIGATHFGFEEIGQVMTDQTGALSLTVVVPTWARQD